MEYFREGGIEFDDKLGFEEVEPRWLIALDNPNLTPHEKLFCAYVREWRRHPEARPSFYHFLDKIHGGTGKPDVKKLTELESRLSNVHGKILFSMGEVAVDISEFYRKYLKNPLKRDLDRGAVGPDISKYFSIEEVDRLPHVRDVGHEKMEEEGHRIAGELVFWLDEITPDKITLDIEHVLKEHSNSPDHMKLRKDSPNGREFWECQHASKYVELRVYRDRGAGAVSMFLSPTRGFNISNHLVEAGWNEVVFPLYYVNEMSS